jgi:acyl-CoA reductase-like NAD-dependent aldehyde dehydrogenase
MKANFIAGDWADAPQARDNINPADLSDVIGTYASADATQTNAAIDAAATAFPSWSDASPEVRSDCLDRVGTELLGRQKELGELLAREEGKTLAEAVGEVVRAGRVFKFFAGEALRLAGERLASVRPGVDVEIVREPEGVVGIITPWNFPIAIPAWKIAPALAYGNCVVFKPAELVPGSAWALTEILSRCGLPDGVFNMVAGPGSHVGSALVSSPKVRALSFTGSDTTGRRIAGELVSRGAKIQLEMGGKNPLVVLDDADLEIALDCAINGAFYSTGQRCTASSRLIVQEGIHDRFVAAMRERMLALRVGNPLDPDTQLGPVVSQDQLDQNLRYVAIGAKEGAKVIGGELLTRDVQGYFMAPALLTETANDMQVNREEIFGPVATVIRVRTYDEALAVANDTAFGLSSGICTTSLKYASDFKKRSSAGMAMVNLPTAGVDYHAPFGGRKASSYGPREQGSYAREFYTAVKTTYTRA